jgi:hypothetical protein
MGKALVAVSGDRKIDEFMAAMGLSDWVVEPEETDRVPERLASLASQEDVRDRVAQAIAENRAMAASVLALAAENASLPIGAR